MPTFTAVHVDSRGQDHPREEAELAKADAELISVEGESDAQIIEATKDADAILSSWRPVGRDIFAGCPNVKVIVRYGIGFDNIWTVHEVLTASPVITKSGSWCTINHPDGPVKYQGAGQLGPLVNENPALWTWLLEQYQEVCRG